MVQQVLNFVKTTLRAPCGIADTQLQLASGTGVLFNGITAGNWCYITVNDATTAEVMKYTSAGNVVNDTIVVERAQDGTGAKAFPVGSCVAIGWNVAQILGLIGAAVTNPTNTMVTDGTPVGSPAPLIIYAIDPGTGALWYWTGFAWVFINSNSTQLVTSVPAGAPTANVRWAINTTTSTLYYWTGLVWFPIFGASGAYFRQILGRQYLTIGSGTPIAAGTDNPFSVLITGGLPVTVNVAYKSDIAIADTIQILPTNVIQILVPCLLEVSASVFGDMDDMTGDFRGQLSIFHAADTYQWMSQTMCIANSGSTGVGMSVNTGPTQVAINDEFDANLVVLNGGGTYVGFNLKQLQFTVSVIALL